MEITEQSSTKRQKLSNENMEASTIDRLSALPDDVVCRILSCLPTKTSVSTCILARRWRLLWAHVPVLEFNEYLHRKGTTSISSIINSVMMRHKVQRLSSFRLRIISCSVYELESWITTLVDRDVQKLFIYYAGLQVTLPPCLFSCKALVNLSLGYHVTIPTTATTVHLPSLKKLKLYMVRYESDESLPRLLSGCPVLEELLMRRNGEDNMIFCNISSPTLNSLILIDRCSQNVENKAYKVKLDTPSLRQHLVLYDAVSENSSAGALSSLTKAVLNSYSPMTLAQARSVLEFVSKLYNVGHLELSTFEFEVPDSEFSVLTKKFHNLAELKLNTDWRFITKLLENADNLQVLEVSMRNVHLNGWMDPKQVPACLVSHLGMVSIRYLRYSEEEFNMVRYILRNAKVLKRMEIYSNFRGIDFELDEARERILLFERRSEECELVFH